MLTRLHDLLGLRTGPVTFFVSVRVPSGESAVGRRETLTSARMEPSSMLPSQVPR